MPVEPRGVVSCGGALRGLVEGGVRSTVELLEDAVDGAGAAAAAHGDVEFVLVRHDDGGGWRCSGISRARWEEGGGGREICCMAG